MTFLPLSDLSAYLAQAPAIPTDKNRSEVRIYATVITGFMLWSLLQPVFCLFTVADAPLTKIAELIGYPKVIAGLFGLASCAMLPHLVSLLFIPDLLHYKLPRKMAAGAMVGAGILWGLLADRSRAQGFGMIPLTYWVSAAGYMLVGGAFGYSLNAQRAQEIQFDEIASKTR